MFITGFTKFTTGPSPGPDERNNVTLYVLRTIMFLWFRRSLFCKWSFPFRFSDQTFTRNNTSAITLPISWISRSYTVM